MNLEHPCNFLSLIIDKVTVSFSSLFDCTCFVAVTSMSDCDCYCDCDWMELPEDVLSVILDKVISFSLSDYIRFAAVCSKWRSFCLENYEHIKIPNRIPMFLKLRLDTQDPNLPYENLYSLSERKSYQFPLAAPVYVKYLGSKSGWIIIQDKDYSVRLLNPFKSVNNEIQIPSSLIFLSGLFVYKRNRFSFPIKKAVLSASPSSNPNDFMIVVIYLDDTIGFYNSDDLTWTIYGRNLFSKCEDVAYYNGKFFVNTSDGKLISFNNPVISTFTRKTPALSLEHVDDEIKGVNLVESSGNLLLVYRFYLKNKARVHFQVFKLVEQLNKWEEVNTLEGHILFLSDKGSSSVCASDLPGFKPNCIYFTGLVIEQFGFDQSLESDMGFFNLEDKSFEPNFVMKTRDFMMAFSWIHPTL